LQTSSPAGGKDAASDSGVSSGGASAAVNAAAKAAASASKAVNGAVVDEDGEGSTSDGEKGHDDKTKIRQVMKLAGEKNNMMNKFKMDHLLKILVWI